MQELHLNGAAVKAIREALGIPGGKFATACRISHGQLSNVEADRKPASPAVAERIIRELEAAFPPPSHPRVRINVRAAVTYPSTPLEATA